MENFDKETETQGYITLKKRKMEKQKVPKNEIQSLKNKLGEVFAEKNIYIQRSQFEAHVGLESKIISLNQQCVILLKQYEDKKCENELQIKELMFDIETLNNLI